MADDAQGASPKNEPSHIEAKEDAETRAARRELKQSSISDPPPTSAGSGTGSTVDNAARPATPADAQSDDLRDQVASPKKKRAHDQLDGDKEAEENDANSVASTDSAKDRASRLEPEKKRHRDAETKGDGSRSTEATKTGDADLEAATKDNKDKTPASTSAFASSSFGKLATGASPFASLGGAASGGSVFGTGAPKLSSFASPVPTTTQPSVPPKLTFGGGSTASPFGALSSGTNGFGSALSGSVFGSALGGIKPLPSFAAPGKDALKKSEKPVKAFGAPDSDADDDEEDDEGDDDALPEGAERALSPEKESDEKKKLKLQKVEVNDGEAGEATVISVRAKMFYHDKEAGWKERGAGMLKINVPQVCVEFDEGGAVIPGSFDASGLELEDAGGSDSSKGHKVARLIMRQDQTHRVILNTAILPAMKFQEKASLKSVGILFTAFEGEPAKPVSITMRMTAANAKSFMSEMGIIQRELQNS
ncbi:Fc.00g086400.m01.CDS01 [Cosmosporella sp. VM-42]